MEKYKQRIADRLLKRKVLGKGAVLIEGPKWCGKTTTATQLAKSVLDLGDASVLKQSTQMIEISPKSLLEGATPRLIDEWQALPPIWDSIRSEVDKRGVPSQFILTGSSVLPDAAETIHSGTGRFAHIMMRPMSLYESGDSTGEASILEMREGKVQEGFVRKVELDEIARLLVRGGWPENIDMAEEDIGIIPESYIETVITKDMHERQTKKRSPQKMRMLIKALARHEASLAGDQTLIKDIEEYETGDELIESRATVADYTSVLDSLYLIANQEAYSIHYRSSKRIGKSAKQHLVDPSLSCASLQLTTEKLMNDHDTFGLMFEALVERDLRIYAEYHEGHLYHFRDNASGDEVDAIVEFKDGEYAAFEIKLSDGRIQEAIQGLSKFYENVEKKPVYMCVIVGHLEAVMRDPKTGIFIVPLTSLRP